MQNKRTAVQNIDFILKHPLNSLSFFFFTLTKRVSPVQVLST